MRYRMIWVRALFQYEGIGKGPKQRRDWDEPPQSRRAPFPVEPKPCKWRLAMGAQMLGLLAGLVLCACTPALPRLPGQAAMTYDAKVDVRFHGFRRTYHVHLPPGYHAARPLPMVVVVHGAFDTAKGMERFTGFSALADQENFIALYPNGIGILGYLQHWNAGHCCAKAASAGIDDVGFLTKVIEDACARLAVDRRRIYMTGFSNGGMMVHRFAAERGDLLAAVAPLAATAGGRPDDQRPGMVHSRSNVPHAAARHAWAGRCVCSV